MYNTMYSAPSLVSNNSTAVSRSFVLKQFQANMPFVSQTKIFFGVFFRALALIFKKKKNWTRNIKNKRHALICRQWTSESSSLPIWIWMDWVDTSGFWLNTDYNDAPWPVCNNDMLIPCSFRCQPSIYFSSLGSCMYWQSSSSDYLALNSEKNLSKAPCRDSLISENSYRHDNKLFLSTIGSRNEKLKQMHKGQENTQVTPRKRMGEIRERDALWLTLQAASSSQSTFRSTRSYNKCCSGMLMQPAARKFGRVCTPCPRDRTCTRRVASVVHLQARPGSKAKAKVLRSRSSCRHFIRNTMETKFLRMALASISKAIPLCAVLTRITCTDTG